MAPCDPCRFVARLNRPVRSRLGGVRKGRSRPAKQKTRKTTPCTVAKCLKSQARKWCEIATCGITEIYCAVGQNRRMMASWQGVAPRMALREKARWSWCDGGAREPVLS